MEIVVKSPSGVGIKIVDENLHMSPDEYKDFTFHLVRRIKSIEYNYNNMTDPHDDIDNKDNN